ncbi:DNA repair helicase XPD [Hondaea fermentalgiana]|uniref:DNA 5'-3' helicase n=1 Tax=Hondaea fermentalgiana TaxID=2315210 RepID=A0A2R5GBS5_9STRA|nr:DNA repair helicase XPD [Hondaea fermentalgiana]|eukprot:GBG25571.1 DNA repair helicase XPD [Hondaea fermentalgiana]
MKFVLDAGSASPLTVFWPYPTLYPEQYDYMLELKHALDAKGGCLLEMPTGTGKTVSLLALITSYQYAHQETGKLVYCTRTVPEMRKTMEELKRVIDHRTELLGGEANAPPFLGVCLSSRRNMCVHPTVMAESDREQVDSLCRKKIAPWVREKTGARKRNAGNSNGNDEPAAEENDAAMDAAQEAPVPTELGDIEDIEKQGLCSYYERYVAQGSDVPLSNGIYTIEEMQELGKKNNWCPYFVTRHVLSFANVVVYNYQYMLDPKVSTMVSKEITRDSIVVFDEAHNIDNVCIEALSVFFNRRSLEAASSNIRELDSMISRVKETDAQRLRDEYDRLVQGLSETGVLDANNNDVVANPIHLPEDILNEAVPGNIRKAEHFVKLLDVVVKHLKTRMKVQRVVKETPVAFLHEVQDRLQLDAKTLQFSYSRLSSLMRTLKVVDLERFVPISQVADFLTLVATPKYKDGFMLVIEPYDQRTPQFIDPIIQFTCLDASLAIKPVLERFATVVITSGTLSPIDLYPKLLDFKPVVSRSLTMSIIRPGICPMVVTRGSDQTPITSAFSSRTDKSVIINFGALLIEVSKTVPDGIVCFFTSYEYMENVVSAWAELQILNRILDHKLLFIETKDIVETTLALDNFRRACDCGRGAVFLSVARGKVSEGIDFDRHYGRCVILFGIPFQYTKSHILLARLEYLRVKFQIREDEFLAFDALRQASQCIGRVIRSKADYGLMIFADKRYNNANKRSKLPGWVTQFLRESNLNLSTEEAVAVCRTFLRELAQPIDPSQRTSNMLTEADLTTMARDLGHGADSADADGDVVMESAATS